MGAGPRTGRAAGFCAGYDLPGYMNQYGWCRGRRERARGRGGGRGRGRYWDDPYPEAPPPVDELEMLKQECQHLEARLKGMKKRIDQLEKKGD